MILLLARAKDWSPGLYEDTSMSAMGNSAHPLEAGVVFLTDVRPASIPESKWLMTIELGTHSSSLWA